MKSNDYFVKHNIAFLSDSVFVSSMVGHFIEHFMVAVDLMLLRTDTIPACCHFSSFSSPFMEEGKGIAKGRNTTSTHPVNSIHVIFKTSVFPQW